MHTPTRVHTCVDNEGCTHSYTTRGARMHRQRRVHTCIEAHMHTPTRVHTCVDNKGCTHAYTYEGAHMHRNIPMRVRACLHAFTALLHDGGVHTEATLFHEGCMPAPRITTLRSSNISGSTTAITFIGVIGSPHQCDRLSSSV